MEKGKSLLSFFDRGLCKVFTSSYSNFLFALDLYYEIYFEEGKLKYDENENPEEHLK